MVVTEFEVPGVSVGWGRVSHEHRRKGKAGSHPHMCNRSVGVDTRQVTRNLGRGQWGPQPI